MFVWVCIHYVYVFMRTFKKMPFFLFSSLPLFSFPLLSSVFITYGLLGPMAAGCRLLGAGFLSIVAGFAIGEPKQQQQQPKQNKKQPKQQQQQQFTQIISNIFWQMGEITLEVFPMVVLGLLCTTSLLHFFPSLPTASHTLLPSSSSSSSFFSSPSSFLMGVVFRFVVLLSSLPLQLCEHSTVTLAAGIQQAGGSPGFFSFFFSFLFFSFLFFPFLSSLPFSFTQF